MTGITREQRLVQSFAKFADTLVAGYDVVDLLQTLVETCRDLLGATAAGILLADMRGELELVAATSEAGRLVELMQLSAYAGPCVESFTTGKVVAVPDIAASPHTWRRFSQSSREQGFASADAIPLRLRDTTIGTLNLLHEAPGGLNSEDLITAQAFADVATIGILHERTIRESELVRTHLQNALNSRVVIEQAKGIVAETRKIPVGVAFDIIRDHARKNQRSLLDVSTALVERRLVL
ncbi:MAG: GAF and ANTAR domain-containing protein [Leifsonia sp.]